jgi:error-prone DNA polymerase
MAALLSVASYYSLMRGVQPPATLVAAAAAMGYAAIAITDQDNLYGLPETLRACRESGVRPIIAAECGTQGASALVYADGDSGFANLCRVVTDCHRDPRVSLVNSLTADGAGLRLVTDDLALLEALDGRIPVWFRMTRPRYPPAWVRERGIGCLIVPHAAFLSADDCETHRYLRAIDTHATLSSLDPRDCYPDSARLAGWPQMRERFAVFEAELAHTEAFAESLQSRTDFGAPIMPRVQTDTPALQTLRERAYSGARRRYPEFTAAVTRRLDYELDMIGRKGFASYFLLVEEIVKQSPRTCGRGSGASSIVAYCLGITNVDPLRYNLMFERFISPGRKDPPDIDVDFAWDERDAVLEHVFKTHGPDRAAMVATHQTLGPRMALRETARVFGLTEAEIGGVTKKFPWFYEVDECAGVDLQAVLARHPRLKDIPLDPPWPQIVAMAQRLLGIPRGIGTHCGGVVITPGPIWRHVPVQRSAKAWPLIHWEKDGAEEMGLVKIDLLGNRSLAVIRDAIANLAGQGIVIDDVLWDPASDPATIDLLARGASIGVFYVESPAMRLLQQKTGRGDFEHLVIHSSIIRPAANAFIAEYVRRLHGGRWTPEHPLLATVLAETFGIMVYQEDVARVAMALAGFTFEEADQLRKIISRKHRRATLADFKERFHAGAQRRGVSTQAFERIWAMCLSFSGYSFCKAHSASYCQVSFQSAWLKAHHPAAFLAAVMSNHGGFYTTQAYVSEAQRLGITILPPDVNASLERFFARGNAIRVGLGQVKGVTRLALDSIVTQRKTAPYRSLADFLQRCRPEESDAERLILAGACDSLAPGGRSRLFWQMRSFYRGAGPDMSAPSLADWAPLRLLRAEYRMLGFLSSAHPITLVQRRAAPGVVKINAIARHIGRVVRFWGWCVTSRTVATKYGESMQFITFEDETGIGETVLFPDTYQRFVRQLGRQEAFLVTGKVMEEFGAVTVEVRAVEPAAIAGTAARMPEVTQSPDSV